MRNRLATTFLALTALAAMVNCTSVSGGSATGTGPSPIACDGLDEAACLLREDCAPLYRAGSDTAFVRCADGALTCDVDACGEPPPAEYWTCPDGIRIYPACTPTDGDSCGWVFPACTPDGSGVCDVDTCGEPPPQEYWTCPDGTHIYPACTPTDGDSCGWVWVFPACPPDGSGVCDVDACGEPPPAEYWTCPDGTRIYPACTPTDGDSCGWVFPACPPDVSSR
ncbi:hypothetical protein WME75_09530 [Sorangium sp. So ce1014]|uniref:hypothetical protein n=1 Tax=Sorangium sp. So ce1014 TaxID=3133326 RepID=UPI003F6244ED